MPRKRVIQDDSWKDGPCGERILSEEEAALLDFHDDEENPPPYSSESPHE